MNHARFFFFLLFVPAALPLAIVYSQGPTQQTGVLRLRVRVKANDSAPLKGLPRKRFFLINGSLEQNRALIEAIDRQPLTTRDCSYQRKRASPPRIGGVKH